MKTLVIAAVAVLAPLSAYAGCKGHFEQTVASCPAGQVWDADKSTCTDAASS